RRSNAKFLRSTDRSLHPFLRYQYALNGRHEIAVVLRSFHHGIELRKPLRKIGVRSLYTRSRIHVALARIVVIIEIKPIDLAPRARSANVLPKPLTEDISMRQLVFADSAASTSLGRSTNANSSTKYIVLRPPRPISSPASPVALLLVSSNHVRL